MNRRSFLVGILGATLAPKLAAGSQNECLVTPSKASWASWKDAFLTADGRVVDQLQGGASHSESQGYGLVLSVFNGDRAAFDSIRGWTEANLTQRADGLLNWRLLPDQPAPEAQNATDGDIFYAWGLALGADRFGIKDARSRATEIAGAIANTCLAADPRDPERLVILPAAEGFRRGTAVIVNPSYIMPRALFDLAALSRDARLAQAAEDGLKLLDEIASNGLVPNWVQIDMLGTNPSAEHPAHSGYDAMRVPLYLIWSGHRDHAAVRRAKDMYAQLNGTETPVVTDLAGDQALESSSFAGFDAIRQLVTVSDTTAVISPRAMPASAQGYYPATLELLAALAAAETSPALCAALAANASSLRQTP